MQKLIDGLVEFRKGDFEQPVFNPHKFMRLITISYILFQSARFYTCVWNRARRGCNMDMAEKGYIS